MTTDIASLTIAADGWPADPRDDRPLGFVNLDLLPEDAALGAMPPYPLIGIGRVDHPLAGVLDAVVEPPIPAHALLNVLAAPKAAAAIAGLLRSIEGLAPARALPVESFCLAMLQGSAEHHDWLDRQTPSMPEPVGALHVEREGNVLHLTLDRPWAGNAIDTVLRDQLHEAFTLATLDPDIARVMLRGRGKAFSVGADLAEFGTTTDPATAHRIRAATLPANVIAPVADRLEVHIQGACVGSGLEMAAFAHRITASPGAWFHLPELAMGIMPGAGGCVSVPRRIGRQRAALMILSGKRIDARTALRWGLVDALVDDAPGDEGCADALGR